MTDLKAKIAIVTGGGSGIGQGVALALAREGAKVVVCGRRTGALERTLAAIKEIGGVGLALQADVSQAEDVKRLVGRTIEAYGRVDILVNNAGISGMGRIHEHDVETWDRVMAVNLRGPFLTARAALPLMREQGGGHIVIISSESAMEHYPGNGAYGVAKHALNALGEYIQRENQELGVRVDTVCPGMVITEMTEGRPGLDENKSLYPEDIADLVMWLLTRRPNIKIGRPVLIQTMEDPWG
jgi:NAD(P)-dependent dehydrogenase (short-subunit alcohol dehydrogenase family)